MFTVYRFFTATGINNTMYSKYRIGNTKLNSKLPIVIFQINPISFIESENLGKPRLFHNGETVTANDMFNTAKRNLTRI